MAGARDAGIGAPSSSPRRSKNLALKPPLAVRWPSKKVASRRPLAAAISWNSLRKRSSPEAESHWTLCSSDPAWKPSSSVTAL